MAVDPNVRRDIHRERTDKAFEVAAPAQSPRIGARLIPVIATILIGLVIIVLLFANAGFNR